MQVVHLLPTIGPAVNHGAIASGGNTLLSRYLFDSIEQGCCQCRMIIREIIERGDVLFGYDQNMHLRLRTYIAESQHLIALEYHIRPDLAGYHLAE